MAYTRTYDFAPETTASGPEVAEELDKIAAELNQIQSTLLHLAVATGTVNNHTLTVDSTVAYVNGLQIAYAPLSDTTGAVNVNVNGLGNRAVLYPGGAPLVGGEMLANSPVVIEFYNGSFYLISTPLTFKGAKGDPGDPGQQGPAGVTIGRNYVFNGDCRIQVPGPANLISNTYQHHFVHGYYFSWNNGAGGFSAPFAGAFDFNSERYAGFGMPSLGSVPGLLRLMLRLAAVDALRFIGKNALVSFLAYQNTGSSITLSINASVPASTADDFSSLTAVASGVGSTVVPSGVPTLVQATLSNITNIQRGLQIEIVPSANIALPNLTGVYGITRVKVGFDANFEPNDADIIKAWSRYERSYADDAVSGAATLIGVKRATVLYGTANLNDATIVFKQKKRVIPTITIYSPNNGATANVAEYTPDGVFVANRAATVTELSVHGFNLTITGGGVGNTVAFHWVADARL